MCLDMLFKTFAGLGSRRKRQFGHLQVSYCGLMKNTQQLPPLFAPSNLWMTRERLMREAIA